MNNTTNIMLTILLVLAHAIELTYELGKASAPYIKATVACTITVALYVIQATRYVYTNRREILDTIGQPFVYYSPAVLKAPKRIRYARPTNTISFA